MKRQRTIAAATLSTLAWLVSHAPPLAFSESQPELRQLYESAESTFQRRQWGRAQQLFEEVLLQSYWQRGQMRRVIGRSSEAVEDLEQASSLDLRNPDLKADLGLAYFADEKFGLAVKALEEALADGRRTPEVLTTLGQAYASLGKST